MLDGLDGFSVFDTAGLLALRLTGVELLGLPAFLYPLPLIELTVFELVGPPSLNNCLGTSLSSFSVMDILLIMFLMGLSLATFEFRELELLFLLVSKLSSNTLSSQ